MHDWYGDSVSPVVTPTFSSAASGVTPTKGQPGTTFGLTATLSSNLDVTETVVVRVYNPANALVYENFTAPYAFKANQPQTFNFSWASQPTTTLGSYIFSLGVVNPNDHNQSYFSKAHAGSLTLADCTVVTDTADNGQCGSLSRAITTANTGPNHTITFSLADQTQPVHLNSSGPTSLPAGTNIVGSCMAGQPHIQIVGAGQPGLVLDGGHLSGVTISGFKGPQLTAHSSVLACVKVFGIGVTPTSLPVARSASAPAQAQPQRAELLTATKSLTVLSVALAQPFSGDEPLPDRGPARSTTGGSYD